MSRCYRFALNRDANEPAIVRALRLAGWFVLALNGTGVPDLLCVRRGQVVFLEVKAVKGGRMKPAQVDLHARLRGAGLVVAVVTTPEEALAAVGGEVTRTALDVRAERRPGSLKSAKPLPTHTPDAFRAMAPPPRPPESISEVHPRRARKAPAELRALATPNTYPAAPKETKR